MHAWAPVPGAGGDAGGGLAGAQPTAEAAKKQSSDVYLISVLTAAVSRRPATPRSNRCLELSFSLRSRRLALISSQTLERFLFVRSVRREPPRALLHQKQDG